MTVTIGRRELLAALGARGRVAARGTCVTLTCNAKLMPAGRSLMHGRVWLMVFSCGPRPQGGRVMRVRPMP
jgi:hypothetical protein